MAERCGGGGGGLVRAYRREAGLTQRQLAAAAGVGVVRDLEQGRTARPRAEPVRLLAGRAGPEPAAGQGTGPAVVIAPMRDSNRSRTAAWACSPAASSSTLRGTATTSRVHRFRVLHDDLGLRLVLASNTQPDETRWPTLQQAGIDDLFSVVLLSSAFGGGACRSVLLERGPEPDEVVVQVHVHGLARPVGRVVGTARSRDTGRAPLPFECVAVLDGQVSGSGGPRRVMVLLQEQVKLGCPEPCPGPLRAFFAGHHREAQLLVVRQGGAHVRDREARREAGCGTMTGSSGLLTHRASVTSALSSRPGPGAPSSRVVT
jgi:transcriptional regulator with XRE-family HTH domain